MQIIATHRIAKVGKCLWQNTHDSCNSTMVKLLAQVENGMDDNNGNWEDVHEKNISFRSQDEIIVFLKDFQNSVWVAITVPTTDVWHFFY